MRDDLISGLPLFKRGLVTKSVAKDIGKSTDACEA